MVYKNQAYSAVLVVCVTGLLVFSKLSNDGRPSLFSLNLRYHLSNNGSTLILDAQLPLTSQNNNNSLEIFTRNSSASGTGRTVSRMENNNGHVIEDIMEKPDLKAKIHDNDVVSSEEDATDGQFAGQFNIKMLNDHLKKCIRESDHEVDMDEYIRIFQQLYKFFCMLGTVFGFIGSDVKTKIEILQSYREGTNKTHYETVEKMIEFEKTSDYIHSNKESSGSRTFLRLHRSLIFVSKFLNKMDSIGDQDGTSRICKDAYAQTLAKFHPWLIQKGAGLAMLGLPTKKDLIAKVCTNSHVETDEAFSIMHDVIRLTTEIYDQCDRLYTENDLHGLP